MTQLERADELRSELFAILPELTKRSRLLSILLDEAQNAPPEGSSDGTIGEIKFNRLRDIQEGIRGLTLALVVDARKP